MGQKAHSQVSASTVRLGGSARRIFAERRVSEGPNKDNRNLEPSWLNTETFKAARVLLREVSAFQHDAALAVQTWKHAFVYVCFCRSNNPSIAREIFSKSLDFG